MNENKVCHIVVDMLYDFIDGTLACQNGENAVEQAIKYINSHPEQEVLYVCDSHPSNHCSFREQGGIWPPHCVAGTRGGSIHEAFFNDIEDESSRPNERNIFLKGYDKNLEQYSGFEARNIFGEELKSKLSSSVVLSGIATEYCVTETTNDLLRNNFNVKINENALAWVTEEGHTFALENFRKLKLL